PCGMPPHQRVVIRKGAAERWDRFGAIKIAERDRDIAQKTPEFRAQQRASLAAPRIEDIRGDKGPCRAGIQAESASAAAVAYRPVVFEVDVEKKLAEKKPRAFLRRDELGIFADPADALNAGDAALDHRAGVDERPPFDRPITHTADLVEQ